MGYSALRKSQVTVEFVLIFAIILLLFIGGFNVWLKLNSGFVTETRDYQSQRLASGQGDFPEDQDEVVEPEIPELDEPTMNLILKIQGCDCIDGALKEEAVNLYTSQYELGAQVDAYTDTVEALQDSIDAMKDAYNQIPWCSNCCLCRDRCQTGITCDGEGNCYPVYGECQRSCLGKADYSDGLINYCASCPASGFTLFGGCGGEGWTDCSCIGIRANLGDEHTRQRQEIKSGINDTQAELDKNQALLDDYTAQKAEVDSQIAEIEPQLSCCGV